MPGTSIRLDGDVSALLRRMRAYSELDRKNLNAALAETARESTLERFRQSKGPDGKRWKTSIRAAAVGGKTLIKTSQLRNSIKSSYFDWAKIRFTEQFQPEISLARKDPASIELGYNGVMEEVFTGFVARPYNYGGGADEITLKDEMLLLEDTKINNTFLDTTPQEVISYVLAQAGVGKKKLKARGFPTRKKLPIRQMSGVQAINAVNAAWSLKERFFFSGGVFYWGEKPEQQKVYTFEYGVNIINLTRLGGVWELETVSAPFVRHSHKINVIHPKISGEQEVIKVVSSTNDDGFIRTRIYF